MVSSRGAREGWISGPVYCVAATPSLRIGQWADFTSARLSPPYPGARGSASACPSPAAAGRRGGDCQAVCAWRGAQRGWSGRAGREGLHLHRSEAPARHCGSPLPGQPPSRVSSVDHQRVLASLGSALRPRTRAAPAVTTALPRPRCARTRPLQCVLRFQVPTPSFTTCLGKAAPPLPFA